MATTDSTTLTSPDGWTVRASVVPVMETTAIDALDAAHTNSLKFLGMARVNGGSGVITKCTFVDAADVGTALVLHLFTAETTQTADAAFAPSDAEALTYVGSIPSTPWEDFNTSRVSTNAAIRLSYKCAAADTALYGTIQIPSGVTPTYGAADVLTVILQADRTT